MSMKDLDNVLNIPKELKIIEKEKLKISEEVYKQLKMRRLSMKKVSDNIEGLGVAQVSRIMNGENYNINTLLKVLDFLELEIKVTSKKN
ncbi:hypothetical protein I0292_26550 (plasmid) [Priestia megaterium]|uniref:hypothetical protein n=1 Tax=Priestia megaterium TaxID=1404 RepID=UPI00206ABA1B|nr:hypothetical protein [Priestia megaterium]UOO43810.1 hypothetical protein I0292_26550 [Priestia megaterium]